MSTSRVIPAAFIWVALVGAQAEYVAQGAAEIQAEVLPVPDWMRVWWALEMLSEAGEEGGLARVERALGNWEFDGAQAKQLLELARNYRQREAAEDRAFWKSLCSRAGTFSSDAQVAAEFKVRDARVADDRQGLSQTLRETLGEERYRAFVHYAYSRNVQTFGAPIEETIAKLGTTRRELLHSACADFGYDVKPTLVGAQ